MNQKLIYVIGKYKLLLICILICIVNILMQVEISYSDKNGRDPFVALVTPDGRLINLDHSVEEQKINLEGIIYDEYGESYAIINGEIVSVGEYILGYSVFEIQESKVILLKDNMPVEYKLEEQDYNESESFDSALHS